MKGGRMIREHINVSLQKGQKEEFEKEAKDNDMNLSQFVRFIFKQYILNKGSNGKSKGK